MIDYLRVSWEPILFYGGCAALAFVFAIISRRRALTALTILLLADFVAWNATVAGWGYDQAPTLLPVVDTVFCAFATMLYALTGDRTVRLVALLYVPAAVAWLGFIIAGQQSTLACYLTANAIYFAQLLCAGGSAARHYHQGLGSPGRDIFAGPVHWVRRVHALGGLPRAPSARLARQKAR